jgi:hypothetical protein
MKITTLVAAAAMSVLLMGGVAFAQATAPAPAAPATAPAAKPAPAPVVHSAASIECSKEADAKGLHGDARKKFRAECKKTAAAAPK